MTRIAIIGDLHLLDAEAHGLAPGSARPPEAVGAARDVERYHSFTERVLPQLLTEVAAAQPDLVLHTGDLAEDGNRAPAGSRELREGLRHLTALGAPLLLCRGNHDGTRSWPDLCGPYAQPHWRAHGVQVFTLDYPAFAAPDQLARLEAALEAAGTDDHLIVAAHAPAYALARPFFTDHAYSMALQALAARYSMDALCCGHTHNQAVSRHRLPNGHGWLQIKGAAVGFPGLPSQPLAAVRAICGADDTELFWGYLEDTAPGWNELIVEQEWMTLRWHALGAGVAGELRWRSPDELEVVRRPDQTALAAGPWPSAMPVEEACLHLAGYGVPAGRQIWLNGAPVGMTPALGSFAPRQSVSLPPELVAAESEVAIETLLDDRLLIGALSVTAHFLDGRTLRTPVDPWLHATSDDWSAWGEPRLRRVRAGEPVRTRLRFGASSVGS